PRGDRQPLPPAARFHRGTGHRGRPQALPRDGQGSDARRPRDARAADPPPAITTKKARSRTMETRPGTPFALEVQPRIPAGLGRLEELANNLWYSWHRPTRALFARLDPRLWEAVGYSPKAFLRSVHERKLDEAAENPAFLHDYN